jgi:hypothetical protein
MLAVLIAWPDEESRVYAGGLAAQSLMSALLLALMLTGLMLAPGLAGSAIVSEKVNDSYDQLHLTLIRPSGILSAKLGNVLGFYFLLAIAVLPLGGVLFFLVGLPLWLRVSTLARVLLRGRRPHVLDVVPTNHSRHRSQLCNHDLVHRPARHPFSRVHGVRVTLRIPLVKPMVLNS